MNFNNITDKEYETTGSIPCPDSPLWEVFQSRCSLTGYTMSNYGMRGKAPKPAELDNGGKLGQSSASRSFPLMPLLCYADTAIERMKCHGNTLWYGTSVVPRKVSISEQTDPGRSSSSTHSLFVKSRNLPSPSPQHGSRLHRQQSAVRGESMVWRASAARSELFAFHGRAPRAARRGAEAVDRARATRRAPRVHYGENRGDFGPHSAPGRALEPFQRFFLFIFRARPRCQA